MNKNNFAAYKKILDERVHDTKAELDEAERAVKSKRVAYDLAKKHQNAFNEGQDELISQYRQ